MGWRRPLTALAALGLAGVLAVAAVNVAIVWTTSSARTTVAEAPPAQVAIVLGARVGPGGAMSPMLADRVSRGVELYRAGAVRTFIVSGDHGRWGYDEPDTMRKALMQQGVPAERIFTDHAGFDTWSTMKRAHEVFGVRSAIVVTQGFHLSRALYLARAAGIDAHGVASDLRPYGEKGRSSSVREVAARLKAFGAATVDAPVMLGPAVPLDGPASASWGPADPSVPGAWDVSPVSRAAVTGVLSGI